MCNLKTGYCVDYYASTCNTQKKCRSEAKRKWRKNRAFSKAAVKNNELREEKRRAVSQQTINDLKSQILDLGTTRTVYIGVLGTENVEIDAATLTAVGAGNETNLYQSIVDNYCGEANLACTYTVATNRRMLADENVTITISYDLDEELYQDLINTGYDFNNQSLVDAIAAELGVDPSEIVIVNNDGTIDIEVTIVDDVPDGEPIGEDFLNDIDNIQDSLSNITSTVVSELGANTNQVSVQGVDYCGDRTCNDAGTCDTATGVCTCPSGYSGVNCEIKHKCDDELPSYCANGGVCAANGLRCHCNFPFYGHKCTNTSPCSTC
jgi:hypothetical protein